MINKSQTKERFTTDPQPCWGLWGVLMGKEVSKVN